MNEQDEQATSSDMLSAETAIQGLASSQKVDSDKDFNELTKQHENSYTQILKAYTTDLEKTLKTKRLYKHFVFWLAFVFLVVSFLFFGIMIIISLKLENLERTILAIIPVIISFLTIFIVIPHIITEYLFNLEEEKYMSEIIKNIQIYDSGKGPHIS